jgi:hypothetical protein
MPKKLPVFTKDVSKVIFFSFLQSIRKVYFTFLQRRRRTPENLLIEVKKNFFPLKTFFASPCAVSQDFSRSVHASGTTCVKNLVLKTYNIFPLFRCLVVPLTTAEPLS